MRLKKLSMRRFPPFVDSAIEFPVVRGEEGLAEVQMFTGENGSGKTRVLTALMAALGNSNPLQDRVRQDAGTELEVVGTLGHGTAKGKDETWAYRDGGEDPKFPNFGLHGAGAPAMAGAGMALLSDAPTTSGASLKRANAAERMNLAGPVGGGGLMQRLLNLRLQAALERDVGAQDGRAASCVRKLEACVREIAQEPDFSIQVQSGQEIRLMANWRGAALFFAELPDGLRSLLNWLAGWVVLQAETYKASDAPLDEPVILLLDEPENHLHPAWQRRVLPALQKLFPAAQIFLVTHSPFIVCSLNQGWIHKFNRGQDGQVRVEAPLAASKGDSYISALESVMGVNEWFDPETQEMLSQFGQLRDEAIKGKKGAVDQARRLGGELQARGPEVANIMVRELRQMERLLAQPAAKGDGT